ncbi:hypothetical protein BX666DRAFT_2019778 [Dichotomocladium elegans]|nr:hypothetical protein BX666DRAFT_2019778 [Dichotomocladium elegans]
MSWNTKTWAWVKKLISVNPLSTDGMPVVGKFRTPAVGSRPEKYAYPKSENSNLSNNYYYQRDVRRNYPRLAVYSQEKVAGLLEGAAQASIAAGAEGQAVQKVDAKPLVEVLASRQLFSKQNQAPTPNWGRKMVWKESEDFIHPGDRKYIAKKSLSVGGDIV